MGMRLREVLAASGIAIGPNAFQEIAARACLLDGVQGACRPATFLAIRHRSH
jgi:hypothetical protein